MKRALNTMDLYRCINEDDFARASFLGVFPRDRIPSIYRFPCSFIINTQPSYRPGEHWLAIHYDSKRNCAFFDSYGLPPSFYSLENFIKTTSFAFSTNTRQLQDFDSSACGYYCIYFILLMSREFNLNDIVSLFSKDDFKINDFLVGHIHS